MDKSIENTLTAETANMFPTDLSIGLAGEPVFHKPTASAATADQSNKEERMSRVLTCWLEFITIKYDKFEIKERNGVHMVGKDRCSFQVLLENSTKEDILSEEAEMNEVLTKYGVHISFSPSRSQGRKGLTRYSVVIKADEDAVKRGAGRKQKTSLMTMEEATDLERLGVSKDEIADMMGISIATYYRRRKKHLSSIQ